MSRDVDAQLRRIHALIREDSPDELALAFDESRALARRGEPNAQYILSMFYAHGKHVPANRPLFRHWARKAALQGHPDAMADYGSDLLTRSGTKRQGLAWSVKAAKAGHAGAQYNVGLHHEYARGKGRDYALARMWHGRSSEGGCALGMRQLGRLYVLGLGGKKDHAKAESLFRRASRLGDGSACTHLGLMYYKGLIPARREGDGARMAVKWYLKGSERGDAWADYLLGLCHEEGTGVRVKLAKARAYFERAASMGEAEAKARLRRMR